MTRSFFRNEAALTVSIAAGVTTLGAAAVFYVALPTFQILSGRLHLRVLQYRAKKNKQPDDGTVTALFTYPVKSLRSVALESVAIGTRGFIHDRQYMLVSPVPKSATTQMTTTDIPTHRFLTQRQCPTLTQLQVDITEAATATASAGTTTTLTVSHKLDPTQYVTVPCLPDRDAPIYSATLWGDVVRVQDMGDAVAKFLQNVVAQDRELSSWDKTKLRLVMQTVEDGRSPADVPLAAKSWAGNSPNVSLADGFPILIASESSLQELNSRLQSAGKEEMPMSRFRPNIVIKGTEPFIEDRFKVLQVGDDVILHVVSSCPRCKQSCTDQETGAVTAEPVEIMKAFRQLSGDNVYFAVNAIPALGSIGKTIRVGDAVKILQTGPPVWSEG